MFTERFYEVIGTDGIAAIGSCAGGAVHLVNTWNKYLQVVDGDTLLIPAGGMNHTQKNVEENPRVELTIGSPDVMGDKNKGVGFLLTGAARFESEGENFERVKEKFSWASRALVVKVDSCKQTM